MPVYVDKLRDWGWKHGRSCHMYADTNEELHEVATKLGLKREWFQKGSLPHYDLTARKRALAVKLGVIEVDDKTIVAAVRVWSANAVAAVKLALLVSEEEANKVRAHLYR